MILRPYQQTLVDALRDVTRVHRRALAVLPTGAGKGVCIAWIASSAARNSRSVVIIANRAELLDQVADKLQIPASVCRADDPRYDPANPVQVCSTQTLLARRLRPPADIVIVDEAHMYARGAPEWASILDAYPDAIILGWTATPQRADESPLGDMFSVIISGPSYSELIAAGHLVNCDVWAPPDRLEGSLCGDPVDIYADHGRGLPALFFVSSVEESRRVAAAVPGCVSVDASTRSRASIVAAFRSGEIQHLSSVGVLTTGFDAPRAACAVMAVSNSHAGIYLQRCGRVLRPYADKTRALVLDLSGAVWEHGHPCDDRTYTLDGKGIHRTMTASPGLWQCRKCFWFAPGPCRQCPQCGAKMPAPKPPRVTARELAETAWTCRCGAAGRVMPLECPQCGQQTPRGIRAAAESDDERLKYIAKKARVAAERGYRPGWVRHQVAGKYGTPCDWRTAQQAIAEALANP